MKTIFNSIFTLALLYGSFTTYAQVVQPVDENKIANGGYDFVSYFADNAPMKGKEQFTHEINGVKYFFASADHMKSFKKNPAKYLPVCDGYCAYGVAEKARKVPVNPETFKIIDGKLYLFFNGDFNGSVFNTLPEWNKNQENLLKQLPVNWAKVK
jgi:YHS domain-containing protein